jgi:hypothetical protein
VPAYPVTTPYNGFPGPLGNLGPSDGHHVAAAVPARAPRADRPRAKDCRFLAPFHEQTSLGSCVPHAVLWLAECDVLKRTGRKVDFARRPAYWWCREKIGTTGQDSGCFAKHAIEVTEAIGLAGEPLDPYDVARFRERPNSAVVAEAARHRTEGNQRLHAIEELLDSIEDDTPFTFAFAVPENFRGRHWPASPGREAGRHQVAAFGYDLDFACPGFAPGSLKIANWWGPYHEGQRWWWMPLSVVTNQDNDFFYDRYALGRVLGFST